MLGARLDWTRWDYKLNPVSWRWRPINGLFVPSHQSQQYWWCNSPIGCCSKQPFHAALVLLSQSVQRWWQWRSWILILYFLNQFVSIARFAAIFALLSLHRSLSNVISQRTARPGGNLCYLHEDNTKKRCKLTSRGRGSTNCSVKTRGCANQLFLNESSFVAPYLLLHWAPQRRFHV